MHYFSVCELLTSARQRRECISDIALRVGFSDVAHFNRSFRRRFDDTPSNISEPMHRHLAVIRKRVRENGQTVPCANRRR